MRLNWLLYVKDLIFGHIQMKNICINTFFPTLLITEVLFSVNELPLWNNMYIIFRCRCQHVSDACRHYVMAFFKTSLQNVFPSVLRQQLHIEL